MPAHQFASILARTDPFDVAQGLERHAGSLSGEHIRALIEDARPRLNAWYRGQFLPLLRERDEERLRAAFARALRMNLRAIPLFGAGFCEGVIEKIPGGRSVEFADEPARSRPGVPALAYAAALLALLLLVPVGRHFMNAARATVQPAPVLPTPLPVALATPSPEPHGTASARPRRTAAPVVVAVATPSATPSAPEPTYVPAPRPPPVGSGVKTVTAAPITPAPSPSPADVSDMPKAYSDATPLPKDETPPPAHVVVPARVPTPTPGPNRNWLHQTIRGTLKTIERIDPFKPHGAPQPTPSPTGPRP